MTCGKNVSDQPFAIDPRSAPASSTTYRLQVPLAGPPTKPPRVVAAEGAGAGAGNVSTAPPASTSLGLNVPLASGPPAGIVPAPVSLKTRFTTGDAVWPPTSDMSTTFWPPGPTSSMSMSTGTWWDSPLMLTSTRPTLKFWPVTLIVAG